MEGANLAAKFLASSIPYVRPRRTIVLMLVIVLVILEAGNVLSKDHDQDQEHEQELLSPRALASRRYE